MVVSRDTSGRVKLSHDAPTSTEGKAVPEAAQALPELCVKLQIMNDSHGGLVDKQTAQQTIEQTVSTQKQTEVEENSGTEKKPWTALATQLRDKWFAKIRRRKHWIARKLFLIEFLNGTEGSRKKWKGLTATTEDRRFQDNPDKWKDEAEPLKKSLATATKNRR